MQDAPTIVFWISIVLLFYIYFGYPILLWILSLLFPVRIQCDKNYVPTISILIAAHNEFKSLPKKIESIRNQSYPKEKIQILVASDSSTDGTNEFLNQQPDLEWIQLEEQSGKNNALNQLLTLAKGEILFFTDANIILHHNALARSAYYYSNPQVGVVAGELVYTQEPHWNAIGQGTGLYWKYENAIKHFESKLGSLLVVSGALFSVRKSVVGQLHPQIANDLEIPMKAAAQGMLVLYEHECLGFEKPHATSGEEWRRTSRIVARGMNGFLKLFFVMIKKPFRFWQFLSHKFLRWFTLPHCLIVLAASINAAPSSIAIPIFYLGVTCFILSILGLLFVNKSDLPRICKPITILTHLLLMYSSAMYGVIKGVIGKSPSSWTPPESARK